MKYLLSALISIAVSSALLFGNDVIHDVAYFLVLISSILTTLITLPLTSFISKHEAQMIQRSMLFYAPISVYEWYALLESGYYGLLVWSVVNTFLICVVLAVIVMKGRAEYYK